MTGGTEGCNYLLAVDVEMNTVLGYAMSSWERGYGDFVMAPGPVDAAPAALAPGHGLLRGRPAMGGRHARSWPRPARSSSARPSASRRTVGTPSAATELEFIVLNDTYEQAWQSGYRALTPANLYNVDYSLLGTGRVEPLLRRIRNEMGEAGMWVESAKGECNFGQHEVAFRYTESRREGRRALAVQDRAPRRSPPRRATASPSWPSSTHREGNSCHIHISLRDDVGRARVRRRRAITASRPCSSSSSPGCSPTLPELTLFVAPNINSYKRFVRGSFAPTALAWGFDNRTCALPRRRPRARVAARRVPRARWGREPLSGAGGDGGRRPATGSKRGSSSSPSSWATPTSRTSPGCRRPCGRPPSCSPRAPIAREGLRRRGRRPLPRTWRASSSRPSSRRSPTGSATGGSSACERAARRSSTPPPRR